MRARLLLCALLAAPGLLAYATDAPLWAPRLYRTTTETGLPHLEENLRDLHERLRSGSYQAAPVERVWIEKEEGGRRPIGKPAGA